ncbi:miple protein precursor [Aphis craccivora]|uniref:Miple protein n=1 Tax=Aphis craccivora TaxID=307492 RepID=A0A6G0XLV6_APHCR|nr:miple protein precursor [Aphis craccivora]
MFIKMYLRGRHFLNIVVWVSESISKFKDLFKLNLCTHGIGKGLGGSNAKAVPSRLSIKPEKKVNSLSYYKNDLFVQSLNEVMNMKFLCIIMVILLLVAIAMVSLNKTGLNEQPLNRLAIAFFS